MLPGRGRERRLLVGVFTAAQDAAIRLGSFKALVRSLKPLRNAPAQTSCRPATKEIEMHRIMLFALTLTAAGALASAAGATTMHPVLGAKLSGMGEHGVVNLHQDAKTGKLCWSFDVMTTGVTGASIHDTAGMLVAK